MRISLAISERSHKAFSSGSILENSSSKSWSSGPRSSSRSPCRIPANFISIFGNNTCRRPADSSAIPIFMIRVHKARGITVTRVGKSPRSSSPGSSRSASGAVISAAFGLPVLRVGPLTALPARAGLLLPPSEQPARTSAYFRPRYMPDLDRQCAQATHARTSDALPLVARQFGRLRPLSTHPDALRGSHALRGHVEPAVPVSALIRALSPVANWPCLFPSVDKTPHGQLPHAESNLHHEAVQLRA